MKLIVWMKPSLDLTTLILEGNITKFLLPQRSPGPLASDVVGALGGCDSRNNCLVKVRLIFVSKKL